MKRELFYVENLDEFTVLDFLIVLILIINLFLHINGFNAIFFNISIFICFLLCLLKLYLYFKETKSDSYINTIRHPIIVDNNEIYILEDNFNIVNVMSAILIILFLTIVILSICIKSFDLINVIVKYLDLSSIYIFILDVLLVSVIVIIETKFILRSLNIKYIIKNINDLDKILKSNRFKVDRIEDISKTDSNSYMVVHRDAINNVVFTPKYSRYNDLIVLINERCSLTEDKR